MVTSTNMFEDETIQAFVGNLSQLSKSSEFGLDLRVEDGEGSASVFTLTKIFTTMRKISALCSKTLCYINCGDHT